MSQDLYMKHSSGGDLLLQKHFHNGVSTSRNTFTKGRRQPKTPSQGVVDNQKHFNFYKGSSTTKNTCTFTRGRRQPKTLALLQRVVDNQASPEMFLLSLPQLLFSNLALFLIANCLRRGSASNLGQNLGQNLKSKLSPLRTWCKATLLNADGGVTCSPLLYHHCLLEPEEISNNKVSN